MKTALAVVLLAGIALAQGKDEKAEILLAKLETAANEIARQFDGVMGFAILDLKSGRQILHHADEVFPTASTIKVAVLAELFRQLEAGKTRLTDIYTVDAKDFVADSHILGGLTPGISKVTNRDLAVFMVAVSDNAATNVLIDRLGMENVNAFLQTLGLKETRLRRKMMDLNAAKAGRENTASPRELMGLLEIVYRGKAFGKEATEEFLKVLSTPKDSPIPKLLPDHVRAANKPGALEGVRCDAGIVFAENRPFILVVMTSYDANERAAEDAISRIAAVSYSCFERLGRSSPYGRVISPGNSR